MICELDSLRVSLSMNDKLYVLKQKAISLVNNI